MEGENYYSVDDLNRRAQAQNVPGSVGPSHSVNISVDAHSAKAQISASINRTQRGPRQVLEPAEDLAVRRK